MEKEGATVGACGPDSLEFGLAVARVHTSWRSWERGLEFVHHGLVTVIAEQHALVIRAEIDPPRGFLYTLPLIWVAVLGGLILGLAGLGGVLFGLGASIALPALSYHVRQTRLQAFLDDIAVRIAGNSREPSS